MARPRNALILASASPRRKALLRRAGYRFRICPSHVPERAPAGLSPSRRVAMLALKKARAIAEKFPDSIVLGADTLVFLNGRAVGKPRNEKHAQRMLTELSGRWQQVMTGVAVVWAGGKRHLKNTAVSQVKFRRLSSADIFRAAHRHLDKAGAYAVQRKGDGFVERIRGDYDNVVGLPMALVKKLLRGLPHPLSKLV